MDKRHNSGRLRGVSVDPSFTTSISAFNPALYVPRIFSIVLRMRTLSL